MCGRGELHLSILIENMRRQGYEFAVSKPQVIYQEIDGVKCEPIERLVVDTPQASAGAVIEKIGRRRGVLEHMSGLDRVRMEFLVPSRGPVSYTHLDVYKRQVASRAGARLSRISVVFPEPDTPVTTVSRPLGMSTSRGFTVWIAPVERWMRPWANSAPAGICGLEIPAVPAR